MSRVGVTDVWASLMSFYACFFQYPGYFLHQSLWHSQSEDIQHLDNRPCLDTVLCSHVTVM